MIPHGAVAARRGRATADRRPRRRTDPQLLTWGLLGPGKGIEHVIDALALLERRPRRASDYTVAGVTHPKVFARARRRSTGSR